MLATTQEKIQMKMLLAAAEKRAAELDLQKKKLADVMKKSDDLISQMLPKSIADDLAKGKSNEEICKSYDNVTMLFSDIVTFTVICSKLKPIQVDIDKRELIKLSKISQVVQLLNNMYTLFDFLCDQNAVYKVETIGDAYLIVAGCPNKAANHALKICDMAFDMMDGIKILKVPGSGDDIHMRIGIHSGPVVAGVVGLKMPRYCLFGTNVGLTEKFESNSKPDQIHISEKTIEHLSSQYKLEERHDEGLKMKVGGHKSYFLTMKENRKPLQEAVIKALLPTDKEAPKLSKEKKIDKKETEKKIEKKETGKKEENKPADKSGSKGEETLKSTAKEETGPSAAPPPPALTEPPPADPPQEVAEDNQGEPAGSDLTPEVEAGEEVFEGGDEQGEDDDDDDDGESKADGVVETVNHQQCCGGLKRSGVCSLL